MITHIYNDEIIRRYTMVIYMEQSNYTMLSVTQPLFMNYIV